MRRMLLPTRPRIQALPQFAVCAAIVFGGCSRSDNEVELAASSNDDATAAMNDGSEPAEIRLVDAANDAVYLPAPVEFDFSGTPPLSGSNLDIPSSLGGDAAEFDRPSVACAGPSLMKDLPPLPAELDEVVYGTLPTPLYAETGAAAGPRLFMPNEPPVEESQSLKAERSFAANKAPAAHSDITPLPHENESDPTRPARAFAAEEFDDEAEMATQSSADDVLAYFPAEKELSEQLQPRVQEAFTLARNGALHAARARFEELLGELAQAKDASRMTNRHSRALVAGLRALEEADDFLAAGGGSNSDTLAIAAGHQTPMLHDSEGRQRSKWTLPHEAIASYHLYAQQKLATATAGEKAGSMTLFGLGKIYAQLAERGEDAPQAIRKSLTMYRSAVVAAPDNHLAANEAGVLLARSGRYKQSAELLQQAANTGSASTTHRNLAFVHQKLGSVQLAHRHRNVAAQLASRERSRGQMSRERGIAWVSPDEFNRHGTSAGPARVASRPAQANPVPQQQAVPQRNMWW